MALVDTTKVAGEAFLGKYTEQSPSQESTAQLNHIESDYDTNPRGFYMYRTLRDSITIIEPKRIGKLFNNVASVPRIIIIEIKYIWITQHCLYLVAIREHEKIGYTYNCIKHMV